MIIGKNYQRENNPIFPYSYNNALRNVIIRVLFFLKSIQFFKHPIGTTKTPSGR